MEEECEAAKTARFLSRFSFFDASRTPFHKFTQYVASARRLGIGGSKHEDRSMVIFNLVICALAVLTCAACTVLLFRGYARSRRRLLFWSSVCFVFLTLNNLLLFFDLVVLEMDLRPWRHAAAFAGLVFMIFGLLRESE